MAAHKRLNILVNLPPTTFTTPRLRPHLKRLRSLGRLRTTSHDTPEPMQKDLRWADAVLMWSWPDITETMLTQAGGLRFMGQINGSHTTVAACLKQGIPISEARHCWSPAVTEMALTLILAGLRRTSAYHLSMRRGKEQWVAAFPGDIDPRERQLGGCTVGIVGFGGIGRRLAELVAPFGVQLRIYDPFIQRTAVRAFANAHLVSLEKLASASDVVVLCAANTASSHHLIDKSIIKLLPRDCVLVNVGRASLIDMPALTARLRTGELTALLDVFEKEPLQKSSELRRLPNVFLTPHRAGGLFASVERAFTMLTDDLERVLKGAAGQYALDKKALAVLAEAG